MRLFGHTVPPIPLLLTTALPALRQEQEHAGRRLMAAVTEKLIGTAAAVAPVAAAVVACGRRHLAGARSNTAGSGVSECRAEALSHSMPPMLLCKPVSAARQAHKLVPSIRVSTPRRINILCERLQMSMCVTVVQHLSVPTQFQPTPGGFTGRDRVASAWLAVALWLYMALGETRLLSQPRMAMVAWAALFGLPPAYVRFRAIAHAVAEEATAAITALLSAGAS